MSDQKESLKHPAALSEVEDQKETSHDSLWQISVTLLVFVKLISITSRTIVDADLWGNLQFGLDNVAASQISQVDLHREINGSKFNRLEDGHAELIVNGVCVFAGEYSGCSGGQMAIFRHRQLNGSQILSVYGHLDRVNDLKVGEQYPIRHPNGEIMQDLEHSDPFLHFAMAYGGTWDSDLKERPSIPINVGASWIRDRYQNPLALMSGGYGHPYGSYPVS